MSDYGAPQQNDQQRNAITAALMGIARPPGKGQLPQLPQRLPTNVSGGMSAIGNAIGDMRQPTPPVAPGPPMSLAPPQAAQQPPPIAPPQPGAPPPQGMPIGAGPPMPPLPPEQQGPQGLY